MATIRVSGVQMTVSTKLEENLPRILGHIEKTDADFIVFPEMCLTGYHGDFSRKATEAAWERIAAACRQSYVTAMVGTGARTEDGTFIQVRVFGDDGNVLGTHEKLVPSSGDRAFCRPGEELRTFQRNWMREGPTHHMALGVGHKAGTIEKLARVLNIECVRVTPPMD